MKLKYFLLLAAGLSAGLWSCKDDCEQVDYKLQGTVYDLCTNQPLKGAGVSYSFKGNGDMLNGRGCNLPQDSVVAVADDNGAYTISFTNGVVVGGVKSQLRVMLNGVYCDSTNFPLTAQTNVGKFSVLHLTQVSIPVRYNIYNLTATDTFFISGPVNMVVPGDTGKIVLTDTIRLNEVLLSEHRLYIPLSFEYKKGVNGTLRQTLVKVPADCTNSFAEQLVELNK